jgi:hypothetical protein
VALSAIANEYQPALSERWQKQTKQVCDLFTLLILIVDRPSLQAIAEKPEKREHLHQSGFI